MISSLSIIIPCFNVEKTVRYVVTNAYKTGKEVSRTLEIIATDDASRDETGIILKKLQKKIPTLKIITHTRNQGYGKTIKELYTHAKYDCIFSLPGDDQFEAAQIHTLIPNLKNADMILGWRSKRHDPTNRLLQSKMYNAILNILFGLQLHDVNTIRLMKKKVISEIKLKSDSAFVDAELAIAAKQKGFKIHEVSVIHKQRHHSGATGGKFIKTILPTIIDILRLQFSHF